MGRLFRLGRVGWGNPAQKKSRGRGDPRLKALNFGGTSGGEAGRLRD